jgi:alginate O-acetyltransferase complex protein AlgI
MNYCLFFPAVTAGPINRYDDFSKQMDDPEVSIRDGFLEGGKRLFTGLFKKFVIADSIAVLALNSRNAAQINGAGWMWFALIFYSLQIYLDFSGYTDIAIGLGYFWGIKLPENFDKPYLKSNLTKFWDSWHITLSQWIRAYYFNPVNRSLRKTSIGRSPAALLFFLQSTTMLLIGLWHGFTWTFAIWGLWHGIGLFVQNRWSTWMKKKNRTSGKTGTVLSTVLTFVYVSLGWVWFLSPTVSEAVNIFRKLLGLG